MGIGKSELQKIDRIPSRNTIHCKDMTIKRKPMFLPLRLKLPHCLLLLLASLASLSAGIEPIFLQPKELLFETDFAGEEDIGDASRWKIIQNTRWKLEDGLLLGRPASAEYQNSRKDHNGIRPMIRAFLPSENFIAEWKVKFTGEGENIEAEFGMAFGIHTTKVCFGSNEDSYLTAGIFENKIKVSSAGHRFQADTWYRIIVEIKDDEMVAQIEGGPTFYLQHPNAAHVKEVMQFQGTKQGKVYVESIRIWSVRSAPRPDWPAKRRGVAFDKAVSIGKKRPPGKK